MFLTNRLVTVSRASHRLLNGRHRLATLSSDQQNAVDNCLALVKQHDFDNYLAGLLLSKNDRGPFFAVRAFHIEMALIKDQSRGNLMSGKMRFQFWRDNIDQIFSNKSMPASQTPVITALHTYVDRFSQSQRFFIRALDARLEVAKLSDAYYKLYSRNDSSNTLPHSREISRKITDNKNLMCSRIRLSTRWKILLRMHTHQFCTYY